MSAVRLAAGERIPRRPCDQSMSRSAPPRAPHPGEGSAGGSDRFGQPTRVFWSTPGASRIVTMRP
jgi:hypothetical protein